MAARAINPAIHISQLGQRLSSGNVEPLLKAHDVVVDCTDNAEARYLLGDAAHAASKPLVFGGAVRMEGQVSVFQSSVKGHLGSPCYRCVFPAMPDAKQDVAAFVLGYRHITGGDSAIDRATQIYETRLRAYVSGLAYAGSPYAFNTVGSTLCIDAHHYALVTSQTCLLSC